MPTDLCATIKTWIGGCVLAALSPIVPAWAAPECGELTGATDYNVAVVAGKSSALGVFLQQVEGAHLDAFEGLKAAADGGSVFGNLNYVMERFPNHPRGLWTLMRYNKLNGGKLVDDPLRNGRHLYDWPRTLDCYFDRALRINPKDPVVRLLHGIQLHWNKQLEPALAEYQKARELGLESSELHYNLGLLYVDMNNYALAKQEAQLAYKKGYPLPGLRSKLAAAGQWP